MVSRCARRFCTPCTNTRWRAAAGMARQTLKPRATAASASSRSRAEACDSSSSTASVAGLITGLRVSALPERHCPPMNRRGAR